MFETAIGTLITIGGVLVAIAIFVLAWDLVRGARRGHRRFRWMERIRHSSRKRHPQAARRRRSGEHEERGHGRGSLP